MARRKNPTEIKNRIAKLEKELANEKHDAKRRTFLKSTINLYCKELGMARRYEW